MGYFRRGRTLRYDLPEYGPRKPCLAFILSFFHAVPCELDRYQLLEPDADADADAAG